MKSENLAIGLAIVLEQTIKITNNQQQANKNLYKIGQQIGIRMCDQLNPRECSYLSQAQTIKSLLIKLSANALGLTLELTEQNIKYEKRNHFYNLTYKQSAVAKSILGLCEDVDEKFQVLEPGWIVAGFLYGILKTMNFYGEVRVQKGDSRDRTVYVVDVKKDIKQQD